MNQSTWIGHYRILALIARGGMGVVYRAHDPGADREVALKVLAREGSPAAQRRLLREAQALAKLRHPNVVQVHDAGESEHGPFIALELVESGTSLEDRLRERGPLSPGRAVELTAALADALQACHDAGILHRDVKPANVLLTSDQRPLLTDFGLALQSADSLTRLSQDGAMLGTPGYFPPEQARGKLDEIGARSDVYGLGATLYALLTGRPPVEGSTLAEVVVATANKDATPPSDSRPEVDPDLDRIVLRCLARDPAQRYAGAAEVAAELRSYAAGERTTRRRPARAAVVFLSVLGLGGLAAFALRTDSSPAPAPVSTAETPIPTPTSTAAAGPEFTPPPLDSRTRLTCRFEQRVVSAGRIQILWFEFTSRGKIARSGELSTVSGTVDRVSGRLKDLVNDLRFDTSRPEAMTDTVRMVAGDLLALVGAKLEVDCRVNDPGIQVRGLPSRAKIATHTINPAALTDRRLRITHGCFPFPPDRERWRRSCPFGVHAAGRLYEAQVDLDCRRTSRAGGYDLTFEAASVDWKPSPYPITQFRLTGTTRVRSGWVEQAQFEVSLRGASDVGGRRTPFEYTGRTTYAIEIAR